MSAGEPGPPRLFDRALRAHRIARAIASFGAHSFLHERAAELAADRLADVLRPFERALVWGDRGGHFAARVPAGRIGALVKADLAAAAAGGVVADAERSPFADGAFDLVVSLLDLHAANDPVGLLVQAAQALRPDGLFLGVMFGAETLSELRGVLGEAEIAVEGGLSPRVFPFADIRDAGGLLQRAGFALPVADAETITVRYADPLRLLADLRGAGESNVLTARRRRFLKRATLAEALALYAKQAGSDGRVAARFDFITLTGWTPHASQPQALKPGSAQVSLADALKRGV